MSMFIRTLNLIKKYRNVEWLTPSQSRALDGLKKALRVPGMVNLCGSTGVGKTFLAWCLSDEPDYVYFPHLECFTQTEEAAEPSVIIDNCQADRWSHRNTLRVLQLEGVTRAVLITRELIHDYTHYVELHLSSEDRKIVQRNLANVGQFSNETKVSNLWHLINPYLRRP